MDKLVTLSFLKAGMLTTVQDRGRWGYQAYGVPIGGAMDRRAAQMANELVRNSIDTPVLEITLLGPSIQVDQTVQIAITGANLSPTINRQPISCYETITLQEKDILSFGRIIRGCRAYLAIRGNWQLPKWLGSYSAVHPNKEVLPESIIKKGDILKVLTTSFSQVIKLASPSLPTVHPITSVRVLVGPEFLQFNQFQIAHFFSQTYQITNNSSRMGYRLEGAPIPLNNQPALISSGIVPGTVQINNAGMPIVLMRDAQTTGGYPRMATVLEEDIDRLAQMKPQEKIRFVFIK